MPVGISAAVDATGISAPDYLNILSIVQDRFRAIYGQDIYIEPDSQDGQLLALFALAYADANDMAIAVYNEFSPSTAQGAGLASIVKTNGIRKKVPTNGSVPVMIGGQAETVITGGIVGDDQGLGTSWALPPQVTIPASGEIIVTAVCTTPGAISADSITQILAGQVPGWQTVINDAPPTPGMPVESDAALRRRQAFSVALPARTTTESIEASIANLTGTGRVRVYENEESFPDANGIPGHSIAAVVEGGDTASIVQAIALKKAPGTGTFGSIYDYYVDSRGVPSRIGYFPLVTPIVLVHLTIRPLAGYVSTTADAIRRAISDEINAVGIGNPVFISKIYTAANLYGAALNNTYNVLEVSISPAPFSFNTPGYGFNQASWFERLSSSDVPIAFNRAASCTPGSVTVVFG